MTHEIRAGAEAEGGPERENSLPNAADVPVFSDPADSDAPPIDDGEWPPVPQWAGTERNEV